MGDEKEGPYKVVSKLVGPRETPKYSIVMHKNHESFMTEVIPDAGTGPVARSVCNLLNKNHLEQKRKDEEYDATHGPDGERLQDPDQ